MHAVNTGNSDGHRERKSGEFCVTVDDKNFDSRTLRSVDVLGLLVFSNNIKNGISDNRDIKRRIMACP